jgi:hypothetical protein
LIGDNPGIHQSSLQNFSKKMDHRVKPGEVFVVRWIASLALAMTGVLVV